MVSRCKDVLGPDSWRKITAGLLKGSKSVETIINFPWSKHVLLPEKEKALMLNKQFVKDSNGLVAFSVLLTRCSSSLVTLDLGWGENKIISSSASQDSLHVDHILLSVPTIWDLTEWRQYILP
jgi:hypothetical protein